MHFKLADYDMEIIHKPGKSIGHADGLSRIPYNDKIEEKNSNLGLVMLKNVDKNNNITPPSNKNEESDLNNIKPPGFINTGNNCFINAIFQILLHTGNINHETKQKSDEFSQAYNDTLNKITTRGDDRQSQLIKSQNN